MSVASLITIIYKIVFYGYGCLIWGRCSKSNILMLAKLQKRAARIILKADIYTPSQLLFKELSWITFPKRVQYHTFNMVYKALKGLSPEYVSEIFVKSSYTRNRILRSVENELLRIPGSQTKIYENSFTISAAKLWNEIPLCIRNMKDLETFKQQMKSSLHNCQ